MQFSDSLFLVSNLCINWFDIAQVPWEMIFLGYFNNCVIGTLAKLLNNTMCLYNRIQWTYLLTQAILY